MGVPKFLPGDQVEIDPNLSLLDSSRFQGLVGTVVSYGSSNTRGQWVFVDVDGEKRVPFLDIELRRVTDTLAARQ